MRYTGLSHENVHDDEIVEMFWRGYTIQDIADIVGTTYDTVKYRLIRNGLLVYYDGGYHPIHSDSLDKTKDEIESVYESIKQTRDPDQKREFLKRLYKLSNVLGEHNPVGNQISREAKLILKGSGSFKELQLAVSRLDKADE